MKKNKNSFKIGSYLKRHTWKIIIGPFFKFLEALTDILTPFLVAKILDVGVPAGDTNYIIKMACIIIAMNIFGMIFAIICQKCSSLTAKGVAKQLRSDLFSHINTFSHAEFDKFSTMSLTNRVINDVDQVQNTIGRTLRQLSRAPFLLIGATVMAMILDIKISLIFIILVPILGIGIYMIMRKTSGIYTEAKLNLDNVSNITRENLSGARVVKAFNKQQYEENRFQKCNTALTGSNIKVGDITAKLQPILGLIINFAAVAIIWIGGFRVNIGGLSQGNIIALINYFLQISTALVVIARLIIVYSRTGASTKRIGEVFDVKNTIISGEKVVEIPENHGEIEFKNVNFEYGDGKEAVTNLSIIIKKGETVGIIGGTGSGKSSVVNLIPRFYDVSQGEVLIDGVNVKDYNLKSLRSLIGIVPQNPTLFKGTLAENMKFRKESASDAEIIKALQIAQIYDFVKEQPLGLNLKVERGGTNFSGGQKQRLTIARALVGHPQILILDDSSSALDFATDASLRKAITENYKNLTTIIVSQRTNSIKHADNIIVMDNGNVVGIGKHERLIKECTVYQEIYFSQNKKEGI
ncbi:MAG: ABC transporter ATP-binding protein [Clostridia bacterium]